MCPGGVVRGAVELLGNHAVGHAPDLDANVVGVGGSDAHAMIGGDLDHGGPAALHLPSYEQVFRTFSIGLPGLALSGDAAAPFGPITLGSM